MWLLEEFRRLGLNNDGLRDAYPSLRLDDLVNAWTHVRLHPDEIEREIEENESA